MRLYKCHAVLPSAGHGGTHIVRTYLTMAACWRDARSLVRDQEPEAEFISLPSETSGVVMMQVWSITTHELAGLRLACDWNEGRLREG